MKGSSWIGNVYGGVSVCHFISFLPLVCSLGLVFLNPFPSPPYPLKINVYHSVDAWVICTVLAHECHYELMNVTTNRHLMVQIIQLCGKKGRITSNGNNKVVEFDDSIGPLRSGEALCYFND